MNSILLEVLDTHPVKILLMMLYMGLVSYILFLFIHFLVI
jgi:hypothetical protein